MKEKPMPLTRPQADDIARIIHALRPDFPARAVAAKLASEDTTGYTPLHIITAAFMSANDPGAKTIGVLETKLADLTAETTWGSAPKLQPAQPNIRPWEQSTNQPFNPRRETPCKWHPEAEGRNCSACRAEWLAGDITETEYRARQHA